MPGAVERLTFGPYYFDVAERILWREGSLVPLAPKALEILGVLIQSEGRLVSKQELMKAVWRDTFVEDNNLTVHISSLRKTLGEAFIETAPRRGYRFTAPVRLAPPVNGAPLGTAGEPVLIHEITRTSVVVEQSRPTRRTWVAAAGGLIATVGFGGAYWSRTRGRPRHETAVAVLPFRPIGNAPEIGLGLADSLITRLAGLERVNVRPTASIRRFANEHDSVEAGRQLGVDFVLDGSVQQEGDRLRLSVQLIRVADGKQFWGETFDREFHSIFAIQDEISAQVAQALASRLREGGSLATRRTADAEAYRLYLMGRHLIMQYNRAPVRKGIQLEEEAAAKDPGFAPAHSSIALGYTFLRANGGTVLRDSIAKIRASASKALMLDDHLAEAHALMAHVLREEYDWVNSEREWRRALELDPNDMSALDCRATQTLAMGQFDLCYKDRIRIRDIDPTLPLAHLGVADPLSWQGRYEEALVHVRRAIELNPSFIRGYWMLAGIYHSQGKYAESMEANAKGRELSGLSPVDTVELRDAFRKSGLAGYDGKHLEIAQARNALPFELAGLYLKLGDQARCLDLLEKSIDNHAPNLIFLRTFPGWTPIRKDPRFINLMRRIGVEPPRLI